MPSPEPGLFAELRRRNVFRVAAMYAVAAWLVVQIADATFEPLGVPESAHRILILVAALGFPLALVLGWLFDWTSEGLVRTPDDPEQAVARLRGHRRIDFAIIAALLLALGMALFGPEMQTAPGEAPPIRAVAVLSFADMSPASDQGYLGDGIAEEIMGGLSKVEALRVTARTSAFAFKGRNESIQTIGEQLGVGAVVEGSVRKAGDQLRITAQLIRVADGFELWSDSFDRKLDDVFAIQEEIARATVDALKVRLVGTKPLVKPPTRDVRAYELYLTGRHFLSRRTEANLREAVGYFERALEIDADFPLAYVGLADAHSLAFIYAYEDDIASLSEAEAAAHRALDIDASSGEAHTSLGYVRMVQWRMDEAETEFREALRLDPAYAVARLFHSIFLRTMGRTEDAHVQIGTALELDPLSPIINREAGRSHFYMGEFVRATELIGKALKLYPDMPLARLYMGRANLALGQETEVFGWFPGQDDATLRTAYEDGGMRALMKRALEMRIAEKQRPCTDRPDLAAMTYALLREPEPMYDCLEQALAERAGPLPIVVAPDPAFADYRSEPRFVAVLQRMGLEE
jgi:TolB-like protein/tetratricopeptide (TPR) repeat protein